MWMAQIKENKCFKIEFKKAEFKHFMKADKDQDGRLNLDEYNEFYKMQEEYMQDLFGLYIEKTEEDIL